VGCVDFFFAVCCFLEDVEIFSSELNESDQIVFLGVECLKGKVF